jgi:ACS family glucarate transporter-like MFS transporter
MANRSAEAAVQKPTRVRYIVLLFAASLSMITYLDRVCISSAQSDLIKDLGLRSEADLKWVFWAFGFAYALFEVPTGWLGDVFGPRKTLIRIVLWWSFFTALTGLIGLPLDGYVLGTVWVLVVVRFLFGMGEAGSYPNLTRALHNWFPFRERGLAQGTMWMSGRLMGGLTPIIWALLVTGIAYESIKLSTGEVLVTSWIVRPLVHNWRVSFAIFAGIGVVWCILFARWFRDRPEKKPSVNAAELALIRSSAAEAAPGHAKVPWLKIIRSRNLWYLCIMYFCQAYGWYFYITYLPRFLEDQHDVAKTSLLGAIYKGGPLWMGAIGCLLGGFLTDWYIRRTGNRKLGRRLFGIIGHSGCVVCFLLCPFAPTAFWFFLVISLAGFSADITMASSWSLCQDIGRRYAAIVAGFMNMIGNLGGSLAILATGYLLDLGVFLHANRLGLASDELDGAAQTAGLLTGYQINFLIYAAVHVIGVVCWCLVDSTKPVAPEE